jgi:hypothetical protein
MLREYFHSNKRTEDVLFLTAKLCVVALMYSI